MTAARSKPSADPASALARTLEALALAGILAVLAARPFVTEMPFRSSQLVLAAAEQVPHRSPDELFRVSFSMVLLASAALWALAQCFRRGPKFVGGTFALLVLAFAGWSFVSALRAVDVRGALTAWLEQTSILLAGLVMMQLARRADRWVLVLAVLAAVAGTVALKGLVQVAVDYPDQVASFEADPEGQLASVGITPGTPQARMFESRLRDRAPSGYLRLANPFASLLIVAVAGAAGLLAGKVAAARSGRATRPRARRGEIDLPVLSAVLSAAPVLLGAVVLVMTRSKGGIAAAAGVLICAVAVAIRRGFFARHRRKLLAASAIGLLAGVCAVAAYGTARGGLPGRSMQVRWEYWVGAARVVRSEPVWGTGPANFGGTYLAHRLPAAAESPKYPHNVLCGSAGQFGLVGGGLFVALLVWALAAAVRPSGEPDLTTQPRETASFAGRIRWCIFGGILVATVRGLWDGSGNPYVLLTEAIAPGIAFAGILLVSLWTGRSGGGPGANWWPRWALAAGLAGFALHNLITYSIFMPATATMFWIVAGAAVGRANLRARPMGPLRGPLAAAAIVATIAAGVWLVRPVCERTVHVRAAQEAFSRGRPTAAVYHMGQAVEADTLDGIPPADLARLHLLNIRTLQPPPPKDLTGALAAAQLAWERSPTSGNAKRLGEALGHWRGKQGRALEMAAKAVQLDPMKVRWRIDYAGMLLAAGRPSGAARQVRQAREIDSARPADSALRLTPSDLDGLDRLEQSISRARSIHP